MFFQSYSPPKQYILLILIFLAIAFPKKLFASCNFSSIYTVPKEINILVVEAKSEELRCDLKASVYKYKTKYVLKGKNLGEFELLNPEYKRCEKEIQQDIDDGGEVTLPIIYGARPELPGFKVGNKYLLTVYKYPETQYVVLPSSCGVFFAGELSSLYDPKIIIYSVEVYGYLVFTFTIKLLIILGYFLSKIFPNQIAFLIAIGIVTILYAALIIAIIKLVRKLIRITKKS